MSSFLAPSLGKYLINPAFFAIVWKQKPLGRGDVPGMTRPICSARVRNCWIVTAESCFFFGRVLFRAILFLARFLVLGIVQSYRSLNVRYKVTTERQDGSGTYGEMIAIPQNGPIVAEFAGPRRN